MAIVSYQVGARHGMNVSHVDFLLFQGTQAGGMVQPRVAHPWTKPLHNTIQGL